VPAQKGDRLCAGWAGARTCRAAMRTRRMRCGAKQGFSACGLIDAEALRRRGARRAARGASGPRVRRGA